MMRINNTEVRFVPNETMVVMKNPSWRRSAVVGESWQPEVAQFLQDMYPFGLENGMQMSDLYTMAMAPSMDDFMDQMEEMFDQLSLFDDDDDFPEDDEL